MRSDTFLGIVPEPRPGTVKGTRRSARSYSTTVRLTPARMHDVAVEAARRRWPVSYYIAWCVEREMARSGHFARAGELAASDIESIGG